MILFIVVLINEKYLRINLKNNAEDFYMENYKVLVREILKDKLMEG